MVIAPSVFFVPLTDDPAADQTCAPSLQFIDLGGGRRLKAIVATTGACNQIEDQWNRAVFARRSGSVGVFFA